MFDQESLVITQPNHSNIIHIIDRGFSQGGRPYFVIHRDIKLANLLIDSHGHLKILDFGIDWLSACGNPDGEDILGTPGYMSPEQFNAPDSVTPLSDIYSVGVMMYHLFVGKTQTSNIENWQVTLTPLKPELAKVITQCMEVEPGKDVSTRVLLFLARQ